MSYDHWKTTNPADEFLGDRLQGTDLEPQRALGSLEPSAPPQDTILRCEHCGKAIKGEAYITRERHSGPSLHYLYFHHECYRCRRCGTNGPHYCPADIARPDPEPDYDIERDQP
jgi:hypothetical protein